MKFEVYEDRGGKCRWRLKANNGQIIATSHQSFASRANARRAANCLRYCMMDFKEIPLVDAVQKVAKTVIR